MADFKEYNAHGIYVAYPENWLLEENEMQTDAGSLLLSHDEGVFWMLKKHPLGVDMEQIIDEAVSAMQEEYEDMESHRIEKELFGKRIVGFEITFFYLDLMNLATVLCFEWDGLIYAVFWQTGNQLIIRADESAPAEKVLEAMTFSFLRGKV